MLISCLVARAACLSFSNEEHNEVWCADHQNHCCMMGEIFCTRSDWSWYPPSVFCSEYRGSIGGNGGLSGWGMALSTHTSTCSAEVKRNGRAIPLFAVCVFMACCRANLTYYCMTKLYRCGDHEVWCWCRPAATALDCRRSARCTTFTVLFYDVGISYAV